MVKSDSRITLANGWHIKTSRLNGVSRLKVMVPAYQTMRVKSGLSARGLIAETVRLCRLVATKQSWKRRSEIEPVAAA